jgi:hypothetical protein
LRLKLPPCERRARRARLRQPRSWRAPRLSAPRWSAHGPKRPCGWGARRLELPPTLAIELIVNPPAAKMVGCGLVILNPPWKFADEAAETVEFLAKVLAQGRGARGDLIWLVPEK